MSDPLSPAALAEIERLAELAIAEKLLPTTERMPTLMALEKLVPLSTLRSIVRDLTAARQEAERLRERLARVQAMIERAWFQVPTGAWYITVGELSRMRRALTGANETP